MNIISKEVELPGCFILGAAGAASRILGMNAEVSRPDDCVFTVELRMCCIYNQFSLEWRLWISSEKPREDA